jgi:branched-subunit amino acid aminotransferase/4-amino-4-deoxychorismate lyase
MNQKATPKPELYCYLNGRIIPLAKAVLPIMDIAVLRGYGVFDSMSAVGERVLHLDDHLKRFFASAKATGISIHHMKAEIKTAIDALLKKNKLPLAKVRIVATGGTTINSGLEFDAKTGSLFILVEEHAELPASYYENGVRLMTAEYERPLPQAKTTNYMLAVQLQPTKFKQKAYEILYTSKDKVYECSTSNFFLVKGNQLITADKGILPGIIRKFVLSSANKVGLKAVERTVTLKDIATADEAFITGTYKGVLPVVAVDDITIGNGKVGLAAQSFQELYRKLSA